MIFSQSEVVACSQRKMGNNGNIKAISRVERSFLTQGLGKSEEAFEIVEIGKGKTPPSNHPAETLP